MIKRIIKLGDLDLIQPVKTNFFKELRGLITIFFAVVIGFAFQEFNKDISATQLLRHVVALIIICMSWWGYHWGIICGPKELNVINIIIDCALLVIYWLLLNKHEYHNFLYPTMFFLYFLWEFVRWVSSDTPEDKEMLLKAMSLNFIFFYVVVYLYAIHDLQHIFTSNNMPIILLFIAMIYRIMIHKIYNYKKNFSRQISYIPDEILIKEAKLIAQKAYIPVTNYSVGAAILVKNGRIFSGCNIEFDNLSNTIHAEEAAISSMITSGETRPVKIAVYTHDREPVYPCGMCLQSLFELGGENLTVIACNDKEHRSRKITELLPFGFVLGK